MLWFFLQEKIYRITRSIYLDNGNDPIFTVDLTLRTWSLTGRMHYRVLNWKSLWKKLSFPNYFFQPFTDFSLIRTLQIKYVHNLLHSQVVNDLNRSRAIHLNFIELQSCKVKIEMDIFSGTSNYRNPQILPKSPYFYRNPPRYYRNPYQIFWNSSQMER